MMCKDCKKFKSYNVGSKTTFDENYCSGEKPKLPPNKCNEFSRAD